VGQLVRDQLEQARLRDLELADRLAKALGGQRSGHRRP
jgi:hypothetical protein